MGITHSLDAKIQKWSDLRCGWCEFNSYINAENAGWIQCAVKVVSRVFLGPENDGCELVASWLFSFMQFHTLSISWVPDRLPNWTCFVGDLNAGCELGADWPSLHHEMSRSVTCDYRIAGCEPGADWF